jgi:Zn finger protein HypA/HybF involved in hydrogenase expression
MGMEFKCKCRECGKAFKVEKGGGFRFHFLRCDQCGKPKSINFNQLGVLHVRYLKGLDVPYALALRRQEAALKAASTEEPISQRKYHFGVERIAGKCKCGGQFKMKARPRCPKCRSTRLAMGEVTRMYD